MSLGLCPDCKGEGFHWSVQDGGRTQWYCSLCGLVAFEDEAKERVCAACGKQSDTWLAHDGREYYWCVLCGSSQG